MIESLCGQDAVLLEKMESVVSRLVFSGKKSPKYLTAGKMIEILMAHAKNSGRYELAVPAS